MTPTVDVVIVSYNTRDDLSRCLQSLLTPRPASLARVYVVDNASTDGSVEAARSFAGVEVAPLASNVGFGAANNHALKRLTAPLTLLLNSDTVVPEGAIDRLVTRLAETGATAIGPRLVDAQGRAEVSFGRMLSPLVEWRQRQLVRLASQTDDASRRAIERHVADEREVDWVSGACLLVRRDAAVDAGLFDEGFFLYEEDVDFCAALRAKGGRILYSPVAAVTHLRGRSSGTSTAGREHYDRSHLRFYEKHAPGWAPWLRLWLRLRGRGVR